MNFLTIIGALEQGLIYAILTMGLFISFRILNMADMTADGSYVSGMAVSVMLCSIDQYILAIPLAFLVGGIGGIITGVLNTKFKISSILSGILVMTGLYSINLRIMGGKPNISLLNKETIFTIFEKIISNPFSKIILLLIIVFLIGFILNTFLKTQVGLSLIATGDNEDMVKASSINVDFMKVMGLFLANALVGLSGGIYAQYMKFSDISGGTGMMVTGVASIVVGETLFSFEKRSLKIISVIFGAIIYRVLLALAMNFGLTASDLRLVSALLVIVVISAPIVKEKYFTRR